MTGASSGIGAELAVQLAERGLDLVLVARRGDRLLEVAERIRRTASVDVTVILMDLSEPDAAERLHTRTHGLRIHVLVNNAGIGTDADVIETEAERLDELLRLNVLALTGLSRRYGADMVTNGSGIVVNISSVAAAIPTPHMAVYSASKTYVYSFTYALDVELRGTGVRAITVMPGTTRTEFGAHGGRIPGPDRMHAAPADVVATILRALDTPEPPSVIVPGTANAVTAALLPRLPRGLAVPLVARAMRA
ncbi:SDR family oxidoreductase [Agromyces endophyticus]|uniref:SDR family NAD(P)-dependent oxidoreductase n=1 Tax=Agromyces sp. H17E-10 TaxID=2932244 RepID=UPI001FD5555B|nr:SDR family oxidoreductase [Agromyces sp. H17E-10]UOQ89170.1 SDR family oxidoreductase [Agromyces sp. H17E-10]